MQDVQIDGPRRAVLEALAGRDRWYQVPALQLLTGLDEEPVRLALAWLHARQLAIPRYGQVHDRSWYAMTTLGESALANVDQLRLAA